MSQYDRILTKRQVAIIDSLPLKVKAIHICTGPGSSVVSLILPTVKAIATKWMRQRIVLHADSNQQIVNELVRKYGIDEESIAPFFGCTGCSVRGIGGTDV